MDLVNTHDINIDWRRFFDRIFVIIYAPNWKHKPRLEAELQRIGILHSGLLEYKITVPCVYDEIIMNTYKDKSGIRRRGWVNESLALLDILKQSQILQYKRILVIEEDAVFLSDKEKINFLLHNIPEGYDTLQLDHAFAYHSQKPIWESLIEHHSINECFVDSNGEWFGMGTAMVFFSSGIEKAITVLENKPIVIDTIQHVSGERRAISVFPMAIQCCYRESIGSQMRGDKFYEVYKRAGINLEDYNLPCNLVD